MSHRTSALAASLFSLSRSRSLTYLLSAVVFLLLLSFTMGLKSFTASATKRLITATKWVESYKDRIVALLDTEQPPQHISPQDPGACRGILLQNIFSGGSGAMQRIYRDKSAIAFQIDIVGKNFVADSSFIIKVYGTPKSAPAAPILLFQTPLVPADTLDNDLQTILILAAQAAIGVARTDIQVSLGNPKSTTDLVLLSDPTLQPEIVSSPFPPESYVGAWIIQFTSRFAAAYTNVSIVIDAAGMKGLSTVVSRPTKDLAGTTVQIVHDIYNRPIDNPWKIGTTVACEYFPGLGFGIIGSEYRDLTIELP